MTAFAQAPEIRGLVMEQGPNIPIPGAEVKIYEVGAANESTFVATVFTGYERCIRLQAAATR